VIVRELHDDDWEQRAALGSLVFGYPRPTEAPPSDGASRMGAFDGSGRLVAAVTGRAYEQWWVGRSVPMCGIAGVAVHPDARGQGLVRRLLDVLLERIEAPVSVLFPTAPGIYRGQGWEVVGTLDDTLAPLTALPQAAEVETRSAAPEDLPAIHALYTGRGRSGSGLLTREGPSFPDGPAGLLGLDVVTVAVEGGRVTGYVSYDRGQGYVHGGPLRVWDCLATSAPAYRSLLASLATWSAVVDCANVRGTRADLETACPAALPAPAKAQPWMLRVLDPVAALGARGYLSDGSASFALAGQGFRLEVIGRKGELTAVPAGDLPALQPQGLALLHAGVAARLAERGLASRPVPELEALLAGPAPEILDYF
jgi:predicted acetyltransferase